MIKVCTFDSNKTASWPWFSSMAAAMIYMENNSNVFESNEVVFLINFKTGEHKRIICRSVMTFEAIKN